jgi:hypothetical protein
VPRDAFPAAIFAEQPTFRVEPSLAWLKQPTKCLHNSAWSVSFVSNHRAAKLSLSSSQRRGLRCECVTSVPAKFRWSCRYLSLCRPSENVFLQRCQASAPPIPSRNLPSAAVATCGPDLPLCYQSIPRWIAFDFVLLKMVNTRLLFTGAAAYASATAFTAFWISLKLPLQNNTIGPYNYHRLLKAGRRVPWRRIRAL